MLPELPFDKEQNYKVMIMNYANRIAPEDRRYVCKENERLVTATVEKEKSGADEQLNYAIYFDKDVEVLAKEVYAFIDFAKSHPDLRFLVQFDSFAYALVGSETLIPVFAKAMDVKNILLREFFWKKIEEQEIENHEGVISFSGVVKKPVMVNYTMFSNSIRYGVAKAIDEQHPYYFAAHGYPCRNDDDYTIARVTEQEYEEMVRVYAPLGSQSNPTAEMFRNKYVENHTPVYEGRNLPDVLWV